MMTLKINSIVKERVLNFQRADDEGNHFEYQNSENGLAEMRYSFLFCLF